jgi:hypothetical protein
MGLGNWGGFDIVDRWAQAIREMAKRATAQQFRSERHGHMGAADLDLRWTRRQRPEYIRAARRKNGVGRPPKLYLERERERLIRAANKPYLPRRRGLIFVPRLQPDTSGLGLLIPDCEMCRSTAALRKSNQRKGRA